MVWCHIQNDTMRTPYFFMAHHHPITSQSQSITSRRQMISHTYVWQCEWLNTNGVVQQHTQSAILRTDLVWVDLIAFGKTDPNNWRQLLADALFHRRMCHRQQQCHYSSCEFYEFNWWPNVVGWKMIILFSQSTCVSQFNQNIFFTLVIWNERRGGGSPSIRRPDVVN